MREEAAVTVRVDVFGYCLLGAVGYMGSDFLRHGRVAKVGRGFVWVHG